MYLKFRFFNFMNSLWQDHSYNALRVSYSFPVSLVLPQSALIDDVTVCGEGTVAFSLEVLGVVCLDTHFRVFPELEIERRGVVGSARHVDVEIAIDLRKLLVSSLDFIFPIGEVELEDIVGGSVALEASRRTFGADEAMLTAQDQEGPVDELKKELLFVSNAVSCRSKLAIGFNGDVFTTGCLETNMSSVPLQTKERGVDASIRRGLDITIRDPVLSCVSAHTHFTRLLRIKLHLEDFFISDVKSLIGSDFVSLSD